MTKNCFKCEHYKDAKCSILTDGLLSMVLINNLEPGDAQYNYDIQQRIMIKTEFAKKLCCSEFKEKEKEKE